MASRVELCARVLVCGVQGNDLVTHKVVARCDALGDGVSDGAASDLEGVRGPHIGGTLATVFLDLEPDCTVMILAR
jgi:hypothetical protein